MDIITTDSLEIRHFIEADTAEYVDIMTNPTVTKYLGTGRDLTEEDVKKALSYYKALWNKGYGIFAVKEKTSGKIIGHCGIQPISDGRIEILFAYAPDAWGKGYATEAGKAVLAYAKEHFEVKEINAMSYPQNMASIAVINKLGFKGIGQEEHFGILLEVYALVL